MLLVSIGRFAMVSIVVFMVFSTIYVFVFLVVTMSFRFFVMFWMVGLVVMVLMMGIIMLVVTGALNVVMFFIVFYLLSAAIFATAFVMTTGRNEHGESKDHKQKLHFISFQKWLIDFSAL